MATRNRHLPASSADGMRRVRQPRNTRGELLPRLQALLYEFHALGRFEEARPHVLWLMEIAEAEARGPDASSRRA